MKRSRPNVPQGATSLLEWYRRNRRDLPWRQGPDPYRVWLSEVMLQQTRAEAVIPYYRRFLEHLPTLEDLAGASEEQVLALWSGLGYYRRARSLLLGARWIESKHGGHFPKEIAAALRIPGVGPYTAAAVLSIAYDLPHPVIDGNVERVVTRLIRFAGNPRRQNGKQQLRNVLRSWMPPTRAGDFNQAMMELGATVCTPVAPACPSCPVRQNCEAFRHGEVERFPRLPIRRKQVVLELELGVLENRGRYLLERADRFGFLQGLWLFPLAERAKGGDATAGASGIAVELSLRLGVPVREIGDLKPLSHSITYRRITLRPKRLEADRVDLRGKKAYRWSRLEDLGTKIPVSSLCLKLARRLDGEGRR